jgi:hypothetical protein
MPVDIQLTVPKFITIDGQKRRFGPGDWVRVGKQTARDWLEAGEAVDPLSSLRSVETAPGTCGIMCFAGGQPPAIAGVEASRDGLYDLRWERTLFLDTTAPIKAALIPAGFALLDKWQMAVPLYDYRHLAAAEDTEEERTRVKAIIHDLRVPLYDVRMIFAKRCPEVEALLELWHTDGGRRLAFLAALYRIKPLIRALPCTWTGQWAPSHA